jgi:hypothetical protein
MANPSYCPSASEKATPNYASNLVAVWFIFGCSIGIVIWYAVGSWEAYGRNGVRDKATPPYDSRIYSQFIQANLLSGLLVSLLVIVSPYSTFPQPIEATFSVVLALSQASALGWLDFPPDAAFRDVFCTKLPDVFALGLTLWAAWEAQETYFNAPGHDRNARYPEMVYRDPWIPFGICSAINELAMLVVYAIWLHERAQRGRCFHAINIS